VGVLAKPIGQKVEASWEASRHDRMVTAAFLLTLIAAGLRIYAAYWFPWEQDELYTIDEGTNLFHTQILPGIQSRPLFFLMLHPVLKYLPHDPIILRALPLLFGIAGVWTTWVLGKRILGEMGGLFACGIVAVIPWHLYVSGFARYYSLLYLVAALFYLLIPRAWDSDRPGPYLGVLALLAIGTFSHPSFVFPIAGAVLGLALQRTNGRFRVQWPSRKAWMYLWGPFLLMLAIRSVVLASIGKSSGLQNGTGRGLDASLRIVPAMIDWMTVTIFALAVIGAVLMLTVDHRRMQRTGRMAIGAVLTTFIGLSIAAGFIDVYADYGVAMLPLAIVCAAGGLTLAIEATPITLRRYTRLTLGAMLVAGLLPSVASHLSDGTRFDYRPAYAFISTTGGGRPTFMWPEVMQGQYAPGTRVLPLLTSRARRDSLLAREGPSWAIVSVKRHGIVGDEDGHLTDWLNTYCRPQARFERSRWDYRLYRVDVYRCAPLAQAVTTPQTAVDSLRQKEGSHPSPGAVVPSKSF
jgi:hypothetical protein